MAEISLSNLTGMINKDGRCKATVSNDVMEVYLSIDPPLGEGTWPTKEDALQALGAEGVAFGLNESVVDEVILNQRIKPTLVAKGKPPVAGRDAEVKYLFESGIFRKVFVEDEFGRIDYRQMQTVQNVVPGQIIAEKVPATPGDLGMNVRGQEIPPVPGKDKPLKAGKNVIWTEDNLKLVAKMGGEPTLVSGKVSVHPIHEIKGDVNFDTGNIVFSGNLVIRGNIESGFKVETDGDVTIYGNVDSADIKSGGNVFIQGGVSGSDKSQIVCSGDFSAKYVEHATITCEGNLTVREAIMHCVVNADMKVLVEGGKGLIVGGMIRSGEEISAKTIGSRFGTTTELEVGISPRAKLELQELEANLKNNTDSLEKAEKAILILSKTPNLTDDRKEMLQNLIKTTYALKSHVADLESRRQELLNDINNRSREKGRIKVKETIYPGVRVTMGKTTVLIQDEIKFAVLAYIDGEIQIQSYR